MPVVVKSYVLSVIIVDTGISDDRSAEVSADILDNVFAFRDSGFGIYIESVRAMLVDICFGFFERCADVLLHEVQKSGSERVSEQGIVEMFYMTPRGYIAAPTL